MSYFCQISLIPKAYCTTKRPFPYIGSKRAQRAIIRLHTGLSQIFGRFTPHRPEEPVLGKPKAQHRLFTAVREIPSLLSS